MHCLGRLDVDTAVWILLGSSLSISEFSGPSRIRQGRPDVGRAIPSRRRRGQGHVDVHERAVAFLGQPWHRRDECGIASGRRKTVRAVPNREGPSQIVGRDVASSRAS